MILWGWSDWLILAGSFYRLCRERQETATFPPATPVLQVKRRPFLQTWQHDTVSRLINVTESGKPASWCCSFCFSQVWWFQRIPTCFINQWHILGTGWPATYGGTTTLLASGWSTTHKIIVSCLGSLSSYTYKGLWEPLYADSALWCVGEGEKDCAGRWGSRLSPYAQKAG